MGVGFPHKDQATGRHGTMYETETITHDDHRQFTTWTRDAARMLARIYSGGGDTTPPAAHLLLAGFAPWNAHARGHRSGYVRSARVMANRAGHAM